MLVTGAASGIGDATARRFADEGAALALLDVNAEGLERTAKLCEARGADVWTKTVDLSDPAAARAATTEAIAKWGRLDVL